jgi:uncharacterized protein YcbK (DUF882 family)
MGDLSTHFSRSEFRCRCNQCGFDTVDHELIIVLELLHDHFNSPVRLLSGSRCAARNAIEGGAKTSQHLRGKAADIVVAGNSPEIVANYLEATYPTRYGIGRYPKKGFTHIDVRPEKARWTIQ